MSGKRIEIVLGKDGSIKSEAFNFNGPECMEKLAFLEELFDEAEECELKDEFYLKAKNRGLVTEGYCG